MKRYEEYDGTWEIGDKVVKPDNLGEEMEIIEDYIRFVVCQTKTGTETFRVDSLLKVIEDNNS